MTVSKVAWNFFEGYTVVSLLGILCGIASFMFDVGIRYVTCVPDWVWYAMIPGAMIGFALGLSNCSAAE